MRTRFGLACLAAVALLGGCARTFFGTGEPFQPWATPAEGVTAEKHGDTLVLRPPPGTTKPLDLALPTSPTGPLLVLSADHDCIAKERPQDLIRMLKGSAQGEVIPGNHLGFTDLTGGEKYDCPSPVSRDAQREAAVGRTVAFFDRHF